MQSKLSKYYSIAFDIPQHEYQQAASSRIWKLSPEQISFKKETLDMIQSRRKEHGPGYIPHLAQISGVASGIIRDMVTAIPVKFEEWEKVRKAMDAELEKSSVG